MKALALKFLAWHTKKHIRKSAFLKRKNVAYSQAKTVAILFSVQNIQKHEAIKYFISLLEKDNKKVTVLSYLPQSAENFEFRFDYVDQSSLTNTGKIKSESVQKFIVNTFDFLFHMDLESSNPIIENILSQSKASCRIGIHKEGKEALYEFMIVPGSGKDMKKIVEEVYYYTKELNKNDTNI